MVFLINNQNKIIIQVNSIDTTREIVLKLKDKNIRFEIIGATNKSLFFRLYPEYKNFTFISLDEMIESAKIVKTLNFYYDQLQRLGQIYQYTKSYHKKQQTKNALQLLEINKDKQMTKLLEKINNIKFSSNSEIKGEKYEKR